MNKTILTAAIVSLALVPACNEDVRTPDVVTGEGEGGGGGGGEEIPPDDDDDDDDDDDGGEEDPEDDDDLIGGGGGGCGSEAFQFSFDLVPPDVMFVLDKSGSMLTTWDHDADGDTDEITRWNSLHNVVATVLDGFGDRMHFGAQLFPSMDANGNDIEQACLVDAGPEVPPAADNAEELLATIPAATSTDISGGTPATAGINGALTYMLDGSTKDRRAMILVTDGAANCMEGVANDQLAKTYDTNLSPTVGNAYTEFGIATYVVGINIVDEVINTGGNPVVNPAEALDEVAESGGAARGGPEAFYNAFDEIDLAAAMDDIAGRIACTIPLPREPKYPDHVEVTLAGEAIPQTGNCETETGWAYTSVKYTTSIELCGDACADLQLEQKVDVNYACPPS